MTASTTHRYCFSLMIGVIGALGVAPCPASDSTAATIEMRGRALEFEFSQAGEALRERLDREAAGDELGAARAAQSVALHRARFLILKRQLGEDSPRHSFASLARDNPFLPDARLSVTSAGAWVVDSDRLNDSGDEHRVRPSVTPLPAWDMYRVASASEPSIAANAAVPAATTVERTWGMYRPIRGPEMNEVQASPRRPIDAADHRETAKQPFLVYRDPMAAAQ